MNREDLCDQFGLDVDTTLFLPERYFDECIAGVDSMNGCLVYYEHKVINCLIEHQEMDQEEAIGWFSFNMQGSLGEGFPTYIRGLDE